MISCLRRTGNGARLGKIIQNVINPDFTGRDTIHIKKDQVLGVGNILANVIQKISMTKVFLNNIINPYRIRRVLVLWKGQELFRQLLYRLASSAVKGDYRIRAGIT